MWRAFFVALGISMCILGGEFLVIENVVLTRPEPSQTPDGGAVVAPPNPVFVPPEWAPWSLMSAGVVMLLYSFTIPRRVSN